MNDELIGTHTYNKAGSGADALGQLKLASAGKGYKSVSMWIDLYKPHKSFSCYSFINLKIQHYEHVTVCRSLCYQHWPLVGT